MSNWRKYYSTEKRYADQLKYTYGITVEDYDRMFRKQKGRCALCRRPPHGRKLSVDHDHKTRRVRGLVHQHCNHLLWIFDNEIMFRRFMRYAREDRGMSAKGSRISRVMQYFREADLDEVRVAYTLVKEIMDARLKGYKKAKASQGAAASTPRKKRRTKAEMAAAKAAGGGTQGTLSAVS